MLEESPVAVPTGEPGRGAVAVARVLARADRRLTDLRQILSRGKSARSRVTGCAVQYR
jgi:hypothetical protein